MIIVPEAKGNRSLVSTDWNLGAISSRFSSVSKSLFFTLDALKGREGPAERLPEMIHIGDSICKAVQPRFRIDGPGALFPVAFHDRHYCVHDVA